MYLSAKEVDIIKASGEKEKFDKSKLYYSLKKSGAKSDLAEKVCNEVIKNVYSGIKSGEIFNQAVRCLLKKDSVVALRYNLKKAIMELGPSGFAFENYFARILNEYGYTVRTGEVVKGYCVNYEIDIIAQKEKNYFIIECKYHNRQGLKSDIKVALYVFARFLDIKKGLEEKEKKVSHFHQPWLVTNTKCTSQAVKYADCVGLKIVGWHYPENRSLEFLIENKKLYPITVLPFIPNFIRNKLAEKKLILIKDLLNYSVKDLVEILGIKSNLAENIREKANKLIYF